MTNTILTHDHGVWAEITLNRPERLNSFNDEMHLGLIDAMKMSIEQGARALLLTGAGRGFCAGQDLSDRAPLLSDESPDLSRTLTQYYNPLIRLLRDIDIPVVCAVNGVAAGAGANIALACDLVLASENAKFIQSFVKVGLIPDSGGTWTLTRALGPARAKALAMTATPLTAKTAEHWGLIYKCVSAEELLNEARLLTEELATGPTQSLKHIRHAINAATDNSMEEQLLLEARLQKICGQTPDYAEGVSAFLEKRSPKFNGNTQ